MTAEQFFGQLGVLGKLIAAGNRLDLDEMASFVKTAEFRPEIPGWQRDATLDADAAVLESIEHVKAANACLLRADSIAEALANGSFTSDRSGTTS